MHDDNFISKINLSTMNSQTGKISLRFSPLLSIIKDAPYAAEAERLIDINLLMRQSLVVEENKKRDEELLLWRHQACLHEIWVPETSDSKWRSWMFGTLLQLRLFISKTKPEDRCQCRDRVITTPNDHWPECARGKEMRARNEKEAQRQNIRSIAKAFAEVSLRPEVLEGLTNEEVCALHLRFTHERSRRNL